MERLARCQLTRRYALLILAIGIITRLVKIALSWHDLPLRRRKQRWQWRFFNGLLFALAHMIPVTCRALCHRRYSRLGTNAAVNRPPSCCVMQNSAAIYAIYSVVNLAQALDLNYSHFNTYFLSLNTYCSSPNRGLEARLMKLLRPFRQLLQIWVRFDSWHCTNLGTILIRVR